MKSLLTIAALATLFPGFAFAEPWVGRAPTSFLAKPDGTAAQRTADRKRCREIVDKADVSEMPPLDAPDQMAMANSAVTNSPAYLNGGIAAPIGVAIGMAIVGEIQDAQAERRGEDLCMYNLGYRTIALTKAELAGLSNVPRSKQLHWDRDYMPANTAERLAPLLKPAVPRLLAYEGEAPLVDGGIRLADLTLVAPEIHDRGFVVKATATHRRTAVLVTPIETKEGDIRLAADPGTVFQEVDYRKAKDPLLRPDGSTWCGPVRQMAQGNVAKDFVCFTGRDNGYEVMQPSGYPWLPGPYESGLILPVYTQPIQLEERRQDEPQPMDVEIKVVRIENSGVYIACDARYKGEAMRMWLRRIKFEKDVAVLPLWDSRLTLTKVTPPKPAPGSAVKQADKVLKAELTHDGDGKSWRAGEEASSLFEY